jgi:predicted AlkP superfamily pyrophosphatase or phosphodiesterase
MRLIVLLVSGGLTLSGGWTLTGHAQRGPAAGQAPSLIVLVVVDQMRADYVERFKDQWSGGLKRLVTQGAWFSNAAFPYLATVTCVGHATIATGAFPHRHGIIHNGWFDRNDKRGVTCTEDAATTAVPYGSTTGSGESAKRLRIPSFAEEMRTQRKARVASVSLKARSAIMMAGHAGDAVVWLSDQQEEGWETSSAFGATVPAVRRFIAANPIEADYGRSWERLLALNRYDHPDNLESEAPPLGWTNLFPHPLTGRDTKPDGVYRAQWERSPYADAYVGRFAAALVESMTLGQGDTTDVLALSFSSPDLVGHGFGPRSQEVQDMFLRLDATIGTFLERLDALVGPERYVLALSSDHGVTDIPEQLRRSGKDGGRLSARALADIVDVRAQAMAGRGRYLSAISGNDVYFEPGMYQRLASTAGALESIIAELAAQPGMARVFRSETLSAGSSSKDPLLRAASLSYAQGASGDLVFALKPGWMFGATGTTHGSASADDQHVPVILFGSGIKPGQYRESATPADIVPTLAAMAGITLPSAEGRVLRSALVTPATQTGSTRQQ